MPAVLLSIAMVTIPPSVSIPETVADTARVTATLVTIAPPVGIVHVWGCGNTGGWSVRIFGKGVANLCCGKKKRGRKRRRVMFDN